MRSIRSIMLVMLAGAILSACVAIQFSDPNEVSADTAAKLAKQVPTYDESQLANNSDYIRAGSIDAYLCRQGLIGTLTDAKVITVLREKAYASGANGLTDVSCGTGPIDELRGCLASIACDATMIKIVTPAAAQ